MVLLDVGAALEAIGAGARPADLESERLEFKEESDSVRRTLEIVADAVVCLANSRGGVVVVGISDKLSGPDAVRGVRIGSTSTYLLWGCSRELGRRCLSQWMRS